MVKNTTATERCIGCSWPVHYDPRCCNALNDSHVTFSRAFRFFSKTSLSSDEVNVNHGFARIGIALFALSSAPALADGFSVTLDAPILPQFSVGLGINYSLQVIRNLYVGISTDTRFTASAPADAQFSIDVRFGGNTSTACTSNHSSTSSGTRARASTFDPSDWLRARPPTSTVVCSGVTNCQKSPRFTAAWTVAYW